MKEATPVEILQHSGEFERLLALYRERQPARVLELGAGAGGTLYHWLRNAEPGSVVVSVDLVHWNAAAYEEWADEDVEVVTIRGNSNDPATQSLVAEYGNFDWIFIDANHTNDYVRTDWRLYRALARPGAVVAFHDIRPTNDPTIEVDRLWGEIAAEYETLEIVAPDGYGIGVVFLPEAEA